MSDALKITALIVVAVISVALVGLMAVDRMASKSAAPVQAVRPSAPPPGAGLPPSPIPCGHVVSTDMKNRFAEVRGCLSGHMYTRNVDDPKWTDDINAVSRAIWYLASEQAETFGKP